MTTLVFERPEPTRMERKMSRGDCIPNCPFLNRVQFTRGSQVRCMSPKAPIKLSRNTHAEGYQISFLKFCPEGLIKSCDRYDCGLLIHLETCAISPEFTPEGECKNFIQSKVRGRDGEWLPNIYRGA